MKKLTTKVLSVVFAAMLMLTQINVAAYAEDIDGVSVNDGEEVTANNVEYEPLSVASHTSENAAIVQFTAISEEVFTVFGQNFTDTIEYSDNGNYVTTSGGGTGEVSYESDNLSVVSVSLSGRLTGNGLGTANIKAIKQGSMAYEYAYMSVAVKEKSISVSNVTLAPKTYDGTTTGEVTSVEFLGVEYLAPNVDYYANVLYNDANAGSDKPATISVYLNPTDRAKNYNLSANTFLLEGQTIDKALGGAVSVPVLLEAPTETTIAITPIINESGTGQIIEYAINQTSGETPVSDWQTTTLFENLTPNTVYYVYARTQENENYSAGVAQRSDAIMTATNEPETFSIAFSTVSERGKLTASVDSIDCPSGTMVEKGKNVVLTAVPNPGYYIAVWTDNGTPVNDTNDTYTIYDISDNHYITLKFDTCIYNVMVISEGDGYYGGGISPFENWVHIGAGEAPANKRFSHWETSSDGVIFNSPTSSETYFVMPANDVTVTAVFEDIIPTVDSVTITPDFIDVQKGTSYVFSAEVHGENNPSQSVIWSVIDGNGISRIDSEGTLGTLTVDINETAETLIVQVTSAVDLSKYTNAVVTVTEPPIILPIVTSVEITPNAVTLEKGGSQIFTAIVMGENEPPQGVEWSVVGGTAETTINFDGELFIDPNETANALTIVATSTYDMEKTGMATVTVIEALPAIPTVTGVDVTPSRVTITKGDMFSFSAMVTGENNPAQSVEWSVVDGNGATSIDTDGTLTIDIDETTEELTVKATATVDSGKFGVATVIVAEIPVPLPIVTGVEISPDAISLNQGDSYKFTATVAGENDPPQDVIWSIVEETSGTTIDADGTLIISADEAEDYLTVVATSVFDSDKFGIAIVTVITAPPALPIEPTVSSVDIAPEAVTLNRGDTYVFTVAVNGGNNPSQTVEWTVLGGTGATGIDSSGRLTVDLQETAVTLTIKAVSVADNTKCGIATVTVTQPPVILTPTISLVEITPNAVTVEKGNSYTFSAQVTGDNNPPQTVIWSVDGGTDGTFIDGEGILTVSDNETATSLTITAVSTFDGSKFGTAVVTIPQPTIIVIPPVSPQTPTIAANPQSLMVYVGDRVNLSVAASVTDGGMLSYQWYRNSANTNIGGVLIDGATDRTYSPPTSVTGTSYYYVVIANALTGAGNDNIASVTSNPAAVTVVYYYSGSNGGGGSGGSSNTGGSSGNNDNSNDGGTATNTTTDNPTETPADSPIVEIIINSQKAPATINEDGVLEIVYTDSDLQQFADSSGGYALEIAGQDSISLSFSISTMGTDHLIIQTDFGTVTIPNETLKAIRQQYGDTLRLIIKRGSFVIALVDADGREIKYDDPDNPIKIALPYTLADGQNANSVIAVKKTGDGNVAIPLSEYRDGYITFLTGSTGVYDALYNLKTYTDTENHREIESISYVSARGLFSGIGNGEFSPDTTMSRAMFVTVLARLAGTTLSHYTTSRFADVSLDSWYAGAVEWAVDLGLVTGVGNGNFAPDDPITKEQMALLLDRFIKISGYTLTPLPEVTPLADSENISAWAVEAVGNIHQAGIIGVNTDSFFEPHGTTTRAEAAAAFVRLIEMIQ